MSRPNMEEVRMPTARELLLKSLDEWREEVANSLTDGQKKELLIQQLGKWVERMRGEGIDPQAEN